MPESALPEPVRKRGRYRRRLRSRIIVSFVLLGFCLTALFAFATNLARMRVENQLVEMQAELELKLGQLGGDVQALVQALREEKNPPKAEAPKATAKATKVPKE